uniref:Candidapepsin-6 (Aspartate protease 6) (Secreted aspartic protease 6)) n=1 Tax=Ganoderma boninense TaxID=34458 RepID=A0A5K1K7U3_9APHY|nr:Candidapepsin-6 (EC (ACP 6) (Aspartate protease 6) (Secreted aspartic protease 6) [Ganoderma boninense]
MARATTDPPALDMSPTLLFAPEDGQTYYLEDTCPVFAQQPLQGPSLPDYLMPSASSALKPPTLVYGWRLGHDKLMQLALDHFPQVVRYREGPATLGLVDEETIDWTTVDWEHEVPNIAETIRHYKFTAAIREYLGMGPEVDDLFNVELLCNSQQRHEYGLTVGSNYLKVIDKDAIEKLKALLGTDEPAMCLYLPFKNREEADVPFVAKTKSATRTKLVVTALHSVSAATALDMLPALLFAPEDGQTYHLEDQPRVFAQQPLQGPSLPTYLMPSRFTTLQPPTLVYGWRLGYAKLMQIALDHFPQVVVYRKGPTMLGLVDEETQDWTDDDWDNVHANIAETITGYGFVAAIREYLGMGPEADDLFDVELLCDSRQDSEYGLTVGSNYLKVIDKDAVEKLEALLATDEPAMWYLRRHHWMWRRVAPKPQENVEKTKSAPQSLKVVTAAPQPDTTAMPLNVSPELPFTPEDGLTYYFEVCKDGLFLSFVPRLTITSEDKGPIFARQPLEGPSLPDSLMPSRSSTLKPPTLVYGWRLGHNKLMQVAVDHFPHIVRYRKGPALLGVVNEETYPWTEEDWTNEHANVADTVLEYPFIVAIREYLGFGPEADDLFDIDILYDGRREAKYGLIVGSNYLGVIDKDAIEKLEALLDTDELARWYLHCKRWMWRRVVRKAKSKTKSKTTQSKAKRPQGDGKAVAVASNEPEVAQPAS